MLKPLIAWLRGEPLGKKVEGASQKVGQGSKEAANKTSVDKTGDQDLRYFPKSSWPGGPDFHVRVMKVWPVTLVMQRRSASYVPTAWGGGGVRVYQTSIIFLSTGIVK